MKGIEKLFDLINEKRFAEQITEIGLVGHPLSLSFLKDEMRRQFNSLYPENIDENELNIWGVKVKFIPNCRMPAADGEFKLRKTFEGSSFRTIAIKGGDKIFLGYKEEFNPLEHDALEEVKYKSLVYQKHIELKDAIHHIKEVESLIYNDIDFIHVIMNDKDNREYIYVNEKDLDKCLFRHGATDSEIRRIINEAKFELNEKLRNKIRFKINNQVYNRVMDLYVKVCPLEKI